MRMALRNGACRGRCATIRTRLRSLLGLSFTLFPSWGAATSDGVDALWKRGTMADLAANEDAAPAGRIDTELAYGFATPDGRAIGTPLAGVSLSESGRDSRLGYRLGFGSSLDLGIFSPILLPPVDAENFRENPAIIRESGRALSFPA